MLFSVRGFNLRYEDKSGLELLLLEAMRYVSPFVSARVLAMQRRMPINREEFHSVHLHDEGESTIFQVRSCKVQRSKMTIKLAFPMSCAD